MKFDIRNIDRRLIYIVVFLAVGIPIAFRYSTKPSRLVAAEKFYEIVDKLEVKPGEVALVALDFGPSTKAENEPQSQVIIEHLFRKRIPVAFLTQYAFAEEILTYLPNEVAKRLMTENPGEKWVYGEDWVNLGFRPGGTLFMQNMAKSDNLVDFLKKDAFGRRLEDIPVFQGVKTIKDVKLLAEFTGLQGMFDVYVQFFQREGYLPLFGHGCTSITIPEAYIFLDSKQLHGLLEGVAGAAWYSELLREHFPKRAPDEALVTSTALGVAHLAIIFLIIIGNLVGLVFREREEQAA